MTQEIVAKIQSDANQVAYAATTSLPRPDYDGMNMGHCVLTAKLLKATHAHIQSSQWPEHAEAEQAKALTLVSETLAAYDKFLDRYGKIADDYHEDYLNSAEGQARVAQLNEAEQWATDVFLSLPDLPKI